MGWNTVEVSSNSNLFKGIEDQSFYFVHSYAAKKSVGIAQAWSTHNEKFLAAVEDGAIAATQFHPEKSGDAGLALIKNWVGML
jgi:glutamine amidotransferase